MHYEIIIALNGKHLFATDKRSITTKIDLIRVATLLNEKFPEAEGYYMHVSYRPAIGYSTDRQSLMNAIQQEDNEVLDKLFEPQKR